MRATPRHPRQADRIQQLHRPPAYGTWLTAIDMGHHLQLFDSGQRGRTTLAPAVAAATDLSLIRR